MAGRDVMDEKVVQMSFDNANFERNVAQSMSTLDKLKASLDFSWTKKSFDDLSASANSVNMKGLGTAVEEVGTQFSAFEVLATGALLRIGEKAADVAINAFGMLTSKIKEATTAQVKVGWDKNDEKIKAVQTIMAATGKEIGEVNEQLTKLNWFTDETSYTFTDMVSNIGKFTATGVELGTAVTAMQGIANWAAISGQNAGAASRVMYNVSQALGTGSMMTKDWMSIENANMATKEFKENLLRAAKDLGKVSSEFKDEFGNMTYVVNGTNVSVEGLRESLSKKWLTNDIFLKALSYYGDFTDEIYKTYEAFNENAEEFVLTSELVSWIEEYKKGELDLEVVAKRVGKTAEEVGQTFSKLASEQMDLGKRAFKAGQEAKTWADAWGSVQEAVASGWMNTFEIIFGNYEEAKVLWTDVANELWDLFNGGAEARNELLSEWASEDAGGRVALYETIHTFIALLQDAVDLSKEAFTNVFGEIESGQLVEATEKVRDFVSSLRFSQEDVAITKTTDQIRAEMSELGPIFVAVGDGYEYSLSRAIEVIKAYELYTEEAIDAFEEYDTYFEGVDRDVIKEIAHDINEGTTSFTTFLETINEYENVQGLVEGILGVVKILGNDLLILGDTMSSIAKILLPITREQIFLAIGSLGEWLSKVNEVVETGAYFKKWCDIVLDSFSKVHHAFVSGFSKIEDEEFAFIPGAEDIKGVLEEITKTVEKLKIGFAQLVPVNQFGQILHKTLINIRELVSGIYTVGKGLFDYFSPYLKRFGDALVSDVKTVLGDIYRIYSKITSYFYENNVFGETAEKIIELVNNSKILRGVMDAVMVVGGKLREVFWGIYNGIKQFIEGNFPTLKKSFPDAFKNIRNEITNLDESIGSVITRFKEWLASTSVINTVSNSVKTVATEIKNFVSPIFKWLSDEVRSAYSGIKAGIEYVWQYFAPYAKAVKTYFANDIPAMVNGAKPILRSFLDGLNETLVSFLGVLSSVFGKVKDAVMYAVGFAIYAVSSFFDWIGSKVSSSTVLTSKIGSITESISSLKKTSEANDKKTIFEKLSETYSKLRDTVSGSFQKISKQFEQSGIYSFIMNTWEFIKQIFGLVKKLVVDYLGGSEISLERIFALVRNIIAILTSVKLFQSISAIKDFFAHLGEVPNTFAGSLKNAMDSVTGVFDQLQSTIKSFEKEMDAELLIQIAKGVAILAGALILLSLVNPTNLTIATMAMASLFAELLGSVKKIQGLDFAQFKSNFADTFTALIKLSVAIAILVLGLVKIANTIQGAEDKLPVVAGFLSTGGLIWLLGAFVKEMAKLNIQESNVFDKLPSLLLSIGVAVDLLVLAGVKMAKLEIDEWLKGLGGVVLIMASLFGFALGLNRLSKEKSDLTGVAGVLLALSAAIDILLIAFVKIGKLGNGEWTKGLVGTLGSMAILLAFFFGLSKFQKQTEGMSGFVLAVASSIVILSISISMLSKIPWQKLLVDLGVVGGLLFILGLFVAWMSNFDTTKLEKIGAAFLSLGASITLMCQALINLSELSLPELGVAVLGLLSVVTILLGAFTWLSAVKPPNKDTVLYLAVFSAALVALSLSISSFEDVEWTTVGKGLASIVAIAVVLVGAAALFSKINPIDPSVIATILAVGLSLTAIGLAISWIGQLDIPTIIASILAIAAGIGLMIAASKAMSDSLKEAATLLLVAGTLYILAQALVALATLDWEELGRALVGAAGALAIGIVAIYALKNLDIAAIAEAMLNVIVIIGLAAAVIAAFGLLTLIPGFEWIMNKGKDVLEIIGDAVGGFIGSLFGSIVGKFSEKLSDALPAIGTNLSAFFENASGFFDGMSGLDESLLDSIARLIAAFTLLTGASIINAVATFLGGGDMFIEFGKQIAAFAPYVLEFYNQVRTIEPDIVNGTANLVTSLTKMATDMPAQGGFITLLYDNSMGTFGKNLKAFGECFAEYAESVKDIDSNVVEASVAMAGSVTAMAKDVPAQGGLVSLWSDKSLLTFGENLVAFGGYFADYTDEVKGIDASIINASATMITVMKNAAEDVPTQSGIKTWWSDSSMGAFGKNLKEFGGYFAEYYEKTKSINSDTVTTNVNAVNKLVSMAKGITDIDTNKLSNFGTSLKTMAETGISKFVGAFKNAESDVNKAAKEFIEKFIEGVNKKVTDVENTFKKLVEKVLKVVTDKKGDYKQAGEDYITSMTGGVEKKQNSAISAIKDVVESMKSILVAAKSEFTELGKSMMDGLVNGINAKIKNAENAIESISDAVIEALKEKLDIHSPSKVMEILGSYITEGLVSGILSKSGSVDDAMSSIIGGLTSKLKLEGFDDSAIAGITDSLKNSSDISNILKQYGITGGESLTEGLETGFDENSIANIQNSIMSSLENTDLASSLEKYGINGGESLANGIGEGISANIDTKSIADSVTNSVNGFDVNSILGDYGVTTGLNIANGIGEGLVAGYNTSAFSSYTSSVNNTTNALTQNTKAANASANSGNKLKSELDNLVNANYKIAESTDAATDSTYSAADALKVLSGETKGYSDVLNGKYAQAAEAQKTAEQAAEDQAEQAERIAEAKNEALDAMLKEARAGEDLAKTEKERTGYMREYYALEKKNRLQSYMKQAGLSEAEQKKVTTYYDMARRYEDEMIEATANHDEERINALKEAYNDQTKQFERYVKYLDAMRRTDITDLEKAFIKIQYAKEMGEVSEDIQQTEEAIKEELEKEEELSYYGKIKAQREADELSNFRLANKGVLLLTGKRNQNLSPIVAKMRREEVEARWYEKLTDAQKAELERRKTKTPLIKDMEEKEAKEIEQYRKKLLASDPSNWSTVMKFLDSNIAKNWATYQTLKKDYEDWKAEGHTITEYYKIEQAKREYREKLFEENVEEEAEVNRFLESSAAKDWTSYENLQKDFEEWKKSGKTLTDYALESQKLEADIFWRNRFADLLRQYDAANEDIVNEFLDTTLQKDWSSLETLQKDYDYWKANSITWTEFIRLAAEQEEYKKRLIEARADYGDKVYEFLDLEGVADWSSYEDLIRDFDEWVDTGKTYTQRMWEEQEAQEAEAEATIEQTKATEEQTKATEEQTKATEKQTTAQKTSNETTKEATQLTSEFSEMLELLGEVAYDTASNLAELDNAISGIASRIENGMSDVTIRPIIDFTEIQNGIETIRGMLANGEFAVNITTDSLNVSLIASEMAERGLQEITEIRVYLGEILAEMRVLEEKDISMENVFNIYGTNAEEIGEDVSATLADQYAARQSSWG